VGNRLYYGDNLDVLRAHVGDQSVDLVYLDPPFNSNASYNILFKSPTGAGADASIEAFDDTWSWGPAASAALMDITESGNHGLHVLMQAMHTAIGENAMMAYLAMMAVRLVELHRVLKASGSLYLHCDPTASHYLKLVLDAVFGAENYVNEIIWKRTSAHSNVYKAFGGITDTIFFYAKSRERVWNQQYRAASNETEAAAFPHADADGRRWRSENMRNPGIRPNLHYSYTASNGVTYQPHPNGWTVTLEKMRQYDRDGRLHFPKNPGGRLRRKFYADETPGVKLQNLWDDIPPIGAQAQERLGYPTQKPRALLERIISASSDPGDIVLDPFCGCGTAVDAAQKLGRRWIGIDVTHLSIGLIEKRLHEGYGDAVEFETIGVPKDIASARRLAAEDPHQFQAWITLKLGGWPWRGGKKGGDKGVDGYFYYVGEGGRTETGVISVKAGNNVNPAMARDLSGVMRRDGYKLGLFVSAASPTKGMEQEADSHGLIETEFGRFPALQIFTLADMFRGGRATLPPLVSPNRRATRVETRPSHQAGAQGSFI
jgi:site-specific DNA-methyltransferase (adenine-specific)